MNITIRSGRNQDVHLGDRLPIEHYEGARIAGGIIMLLFGGVFAAFPVLFFVLATLDGEEPIPFFALLLLGVFLLVGLGIMALGLSGFLHRLSITIDGESVRGLRRGLKGTRTWNDPLSSYQGVFAEEEYHSGGKNRSSYTLYKIVLKHAAQTRDVLLYSSRSSDEHRAETEAFAKLVGRPVIVGDPDGRYTERSISDLDKSVRELVAEGKLEARFDPYLPPQQGKLTLRQEDNGYVFEHHYRAVSSLGFGATFSAAGMGMLYWYYGPGLPASAEGSPWVVVVVGLVFALVGVFAMVSCQFATSTLRVVPEGVHGYSTLFGWRMAETRLQASDIEEVMVRKDKQRKLALHVSGDTGTLRFGGQALRDEELEYVRNGVIATIARSYR